MSIDLVILGAADVEMSAIEKLCDAAGIRVAYAVGPLGVRVTPREMYDATDWHGRDDKTDFDGHVSGDSVVVAVECGGHGVPTNAIRVDHHRPGDPGYGLPPDEFLRASSLGQFISLLAIHHPGCEWATDVNDPSKWWDSGQDQEFDEKCGRMVSRWPTGHIDTDDDNRWVVAVSSGTNDEDDGLVLVIPDELVMTAASDHCLEAAYRGRCPGVRPDDLMKWRLAVRARHQGKSEDELTLAVYAAFKSLQTAPLFDVTQGRTPGHAVLIRDLRNQPTIPELPEAACRMGGSCYMACVRDVKDGRRKIVCQAGTPEEISSWMSWAEREGLREIYGDPARGFAGGYIA